jgi:hypothetical protein
MKRHIKVAFSFFIVFFLIFASLPISYALTGTTVGTSTSAYATLSPFQRKSFYANGLFWVFYSDGTNMVANYSSDGSTWYKCPQNPIRAAAYGYFSVWFDGTYLHYAYAIGGSIYYRRGTPNSNGTITWSADEQTVSTQYNKAYHPFVSVDSNGYVWIGYRDQTGSNYYPYVIKSGNNDGTWGTTPSGFPYKLSTTSSTSWKVSVVPLTSGKMLAIYAYVNTVRARRWDGSAWGSEVATTSAIYAGSYHSAVAQGDDVHLVFLKSTGYDIIYTKYSYSTNSFGTETTLQAGASITSTPVISIDANTNDLYVFAATTTTGTPSGWTANHIYYKKYTASTGQWGNWTDWIDETSEVLTSADQLTCFYKAYGNYIGLVYMTKTASPYNVKFAFLSLAPPKAWRDVETWFISLLTMKWNYVENWFVNFLTMSWHDVEVYFVKLCTMIWRNVEEWSFQSIVLICHTVEEWFVKFWTLEAIYISTPTIKWGMVFALAIVFGIVLALMFEEGKKK